MDRKHIDWLLLVLGLILISGFFLLAQEAPKTAPVPMPTSAAPEVPPEARKLLQILQARAGGLQDSQAVLQKELDTVIAEFNRTVQKLNAAAPAGYELGEGFTYVKKKDKEK